MEGYMADDTIVRGCQIICEVLERRTGGAPVGVHVQLSPVECKALEELFKVLYVRTSGIPGAIYLAYRS